MSKAEKTLALILNATSDSNFSFRDICSLLLSLGFRERIKGSHHIFARDDFSGSIHWDGVVRVEDQLTGELIDDWTVTSRSGFDYSKPFTPVPEPSSTALVGLAFLSLVAVTHRRAR